MKKRIALVLGSGGARGARSSAAFTPPASLTNTATGFKTWITSTYYGWSM